MKDIGAAAGCTVFISFEEARGGRVTSQFNTTDGLETRKRAGPSIVASVETDVPRTLVWFRRVVVGRPRERAGSGRRSVRGDARGLLLLVEQIRHVSN